MFPFFMICLSPVSSTCSRWAFFFAPPQKLLFSRLRMTFLYWQFQNWILCSYLIQISSSIWHTTYFLFEIVLLFPLHYTLLFSPTLLVIASQSLLMILILRYTLTVRKHQGFSPEHLFSLLYFLPSWSHLVSWRWIALIYIINHHHWKCWVLSMCQALYFKCIRLI